MVMDVTEHTRLIHLASEVGQRLHLAGLRLVTAESCTGGWVAKMITDVAGSSAWFDRGFVSYTNQSKQDMLGVSAALLNEHGAVSEAVVRAMAQGALSHSEGDISLAITGIAGPGGGTPQKPVGLVWLGWARRDGHQAVRRGLFEGDRHGVREQAVVAALEGVLEQLGA
jgi:nicotinamide-nucleotide amidase